MTLPQADSGSSAGASGPGMREASAGGLGAALVAQADLDAITALIQRLSTAPLLQQLDAIVAALDSTDPVRARRRVGWFGRLMGRDIVEQAQADPIEQRVRVALSFAQSHADKLSVQLADLRTAAEGLQYQLGLLDATVGDARASGAADDAAARRLLHLDLVAASWTAALAHVAMVSDHARRLLERHAQVRDVLVPLWRQHAAANAAGEQLRVPAQPDRLARLQRELRIGLASLHESAEAIPPQHNEANATPKEPLP